MIINSPFISGSAIITGNLTVSGSISGEISGSVNSAISASYAVNTTNAESAINATNAISAQTASYADNFTVAGTITAQKLVVETVSSSVVYSSGSNVFGNSLSNTQVLSGSVNVAGSLSVNNSTAILSNQTSSMSVANASTATTWQTARTLTIGSTGKSINGGSDTSFTLNEIGAYAATNPSGYTTNTGTVTSVGGTGTVSGLSLSGTVTSTGNLTLGGTLSLTSGNVTTALGYTPYNATNPNGYTTNTGTVTSVATSGGYGGLTLTGGTITTSGTITLGGTPTGTWPISVSGNATYSLNSTRLYASDAPYTYGGAAPYYMSMTYDGSRWFLQVSPASPSAVRVSYADSAGSLSNMNISQFTNNSGYITGYTETDTLASVTNRGFTTGQNIEFTNGRKGLVGVYNAAQTQAIFAMGSAYVLTNGGASNNIGNLYGLAWSYNPNYGGSGNNPQSISGLNHQLLLMQAGVTTAAMGSGVWTSGAVYGTVFYDVNNTGYYVDPASTSTLYDLTIIGASNKYLYINPGNGYEAMVRYNGGSGSGWYVGKRLTSQVVGTESFHFYSEAAVQTVSGIDTSGNIFSIGSMRSPIFYDSNDTTYYTNPNGISSVYGVAIRGDQSSTDTSNQIFFWGSNNTTTSAIGFKANGGAFPNPTGNGDGYNTYLTMDSVGRGWVFRRGTGGSDFSAAYTSGWILNNGIWQANDSMRAPIFYDSNNTGYYLNPASTSRLSSIDYGTSGYYFGAGDWGWRHNTPYGWIQFGPANSGHAHIYTSLSNFYFNAQIQVNGGSQINTSDIRANVFYDANNTAYYFDGSSTGDSIRVAGDIVAYYSDERLKDIKENIPNAINKVLSLNGFYYQPNEIAQKLGYKKKLEIGLSAQEVERILPEIIKDAPIGHGYKTLDYGKLTPLLVEAIKEQQQQIEELKTLINNLTK